MFPVEGRLRCRAEEGARRRGGGGAHDRTFSMLSSVKYAVIRYPCYCLDTDCSQTDNIFFLVPLFLDLI